MTGRPNNRAYVVYGGGGFPVVGACYCCSVVGRVTSAVIRGVRAVVVNGAVISVLFKGETPRAPRAPLSAGLLFGPLSLRSLGVVRPFAYDHWTGASLPATNLR